MSRAGTSAGGGAIAAAAAGRDVLLAVGNEFLGRCRLTRLEGDDRFDLLAFVLQRQFLYKRLPSPLPVP